MIEPTIICPNCHTEIKLPESLAAPLIESTKKMYEQRIAQKEVEVSIEFNSLNLRCTTNLPIPPFDVI